MITQANSKVGTRARLLTADIRDLPDLGTFELISCLDDAVNYLLDESELDGTSMHEVVADGEAVVVARAESGQLCALANTCSHFGGPLARGEREGDIVICPWHGSRFNICTGAVAGGPAVFPQPRFEARTRDGRVEVRRAR